MDEQKSSGLIADATTVIDSRDESKESKIEIGQSAPAEVVPKPGSLKLRSFWSKLSDSQATIIAALITSLISLVVSGVVAFQTLYVEKYKIDLTGNAKLIEQLNIARGTAIKSIQELRDTIREITENSAMPFGAAKGMLASASQKLLSAYAEGIKDLNSKDPIQERFRQSFHSAKNKGLEVLIRLSKEEQSESKQLSEETIRFLKDAQTDLDKYQTEIRADRIKPSGELN